MKIQSLKDISHLYDTYIVDITGVVHNGIEPYIKGVKALNELISGGKKVVFLSNTSRLAKEVKAKIESMGMKGEFKLITSGEFFLHDLKAGDYCPSLQQPSYLIGNKLIDAIRSKLLLTDDPAKAHNAILFHTSEDLIEMEALKPQLELATKYNLTGICINPDRIAIDGKKFVYTPGTLAKMYEEIGGKVIGYGKPNLPIYQYIAKLFPLDKARTLAIGDFLETDVLGARNFGISSLLVLDGNHKHDSLPAEKLFSKYGIKPSYWIEVLQ